MEPWDGPAAIAATDGRWVIAGLDRNGLRPLRYAVTADDLLIVGSETGMVRARRGRHRREGPRRPGPDDRRRSGRRRGSTDDALKDLLAARQPFGDWTKHITVIDHIVKTDAAGADASSTPRCCAAARSPSA